MSYFVEKRMSGVAINEPGIFISVCTNIILNIIIKFVSPNFGIPTMKMSRLSDFEKAYLSFDSNGVINLSNKQR